ncbi:hypothetical protein O181_097243 [Austropuccinia psidii MF-1]|uniref:CCHC-type domain-containing protein n=1 Tax=Austropuccinia psidii MF-1 TaxID=1389203 RepID=A0A9Q3J742_9BASI|nr:hypothetical protein [Austropuccinia psidii MF-1]
MSVSTHARKAAADATITKPLSNKEVPTLLNLLKSARTSGAEEMQSLWMALLSLPPPISSLQHTLRLNSAAYNHFMPEPYGAADCFNQGDNKPSSTFVGQVIINASQQKDEPLQEVYPIVYHVSDTPASTFVFSGPHSPYNPFLMPSASDVRRPLTHLVDKFGASCFHCGRTGHWRADFPQKGNGKS